MQTHAVRPARQSMLANLTIGRHPMDVVRTSVCIIYFLFENEAQTDHTLGREGGAGDGGCVLTEVRQAIPTGFSLLTVHHPIQSNAGSLFSNANMSSITKGCSSGAYAGFPGTHVPPPPPPSRGDKPVKERNGPTRLNALEHTTSPRGSSTPFVSAGADTCLR